MNSGEGRGFAIGDSDELKKGCPSMVPEKALGPKRITDRWLLMLDGGGFHKAPSAPAMEASVSGRAAKKGEVDAHRKNRS
jgi:hypothetical protein